MPRSVHTKKASNILESVCLSSLTTAIFNIFQLLEFLTLYSYLVITGTLLFVASFKWPCLFHSIFSIFSSFMHHMRCSASQGMNMA